MQKEIDLNCGIYQIRNIATRFCYGGQSIDLKRREYSHWNDLRKNNGKENQHLQNSYNKHGEEKFVFEILLYCFKKDLTQYEQIFDNINKSHGLSYNIRECVDSNKGTKWAEEAKIKQSIRMSGKNHYMYGKHHSLKTRKKQSKSAKNKPPVSEKTKKKLSLIMKKKIYLFITKKDIILEIINMLNNEFSQKDIIKKLNVSRNTVYRTKKGFYNNIYNLSKKEWRYDAKITKKTIVLKIIDKLDRGVFLNHIAKDLGVNMSVVHKVKNGWYNEIYCLPKKEWDYVSNKGKNNILTIKKNVVLKVLEMLDNNILQKNIAKKINISEASVSKIKNGFYDDIYDLKNSRR